MEIVKIISDHKKRFGHKGLDYTYTPPKAGTKRVMAVVRVFGKTATRHIDVPV
jgi:hypothetical protein